jgi:uncharacterized protein YndB with AHSA1/START domain
MTQPTTTQIDPVVRDIVVHAPVDTCYRVFVDELTTWWPPEHHIGEDRTVAEFRVEPFVGGRCYDIDTDGGESHWGTVMAVEPPRRFAFAWHVQGDWTLDLDPAHQSEVEVNFEAVDDTTTHVTLVHRHLERHIRGAANVAAGVASPGGWSAGLARFGDVVEGRPPRPLPTGD